MNFKEKLNSLPASKTMKFIELFFLEYDKVSKRLVKPTRSRYYESDYVKLLNKKLNDTKLEKEIVKMVPYTSYGVLRVLMDIAMDLQQFAKLTNNG